MASIPHINRGQSEILRQELERRRAQARQRLLRMHFESGVGHIGGNLSVLDLLLTLHHDVMTAHDQFILSKGHAAGALYITLWTLGTLSDDDLNQFHRENTLLSAHPPAMGIDAILFATGSLGHGLGLANGLALALRLQGRPGRIFCITSDGEWNEGSTWESLIFACHRQLDNLVVIVDLNGLQGFGRTAEVADLSPIADRFRSFGAAVDEIDGHSPEELINSAAQRFQSKPLVIVAKTHKGAGVSFMEDRMEWHYLPMTPEQYRQALLDVGGP
jgi:transketolase